MCFELITCIVPELEIHCNVVVGVLIDHALQDLRSCSHVCGMQDIVVIAVHTLFDEPRILLGYCALKSHIKP
jgi:hypothetical protein